MTKYPRRAAFLAIGGVVANRIRAFYLVLVFLLALPSGVAFAALGTSITLGSGQPNHILPGQTTQFQITLSNSNAGAAITNVHFPSISSVTLDGTLPNGLKISGAVTYTCTDPVGPTTSAGVGTLTAVVGSQNLVLTGGVIPARDTLSATDGTCTIIVPVTAGTSTGNSATYGLTINAGEVSGVDPGAVANAGTVSQTINIDPMTPPSIGKSFTASTLFLGGNATPLTITLGNTNAVPITNFNISDALPAIVKVATPLTTSASCNNGGSTPVITAVAGGASISATGTIPAKVGPTNGLCTITVNVEAATTSGGFSASATNTINKSADFTNDIGIAAAANANSVITVRSPLRVTKTFGHSFLAGGQSDTLTVTLFNDGNTDLSITSFTDDAIDGTAPGNANAFGLKVTGQSTTCGGAVAATTNNTGVTQTGGTIPHNSSCAVTVTFTGVPQVPGTPITFTNNIPQGAVDVGNPALVSQTASAAITVVDDLRVTKTATPESVAPGNPIRYSVTVENFGAGAIANVVIADPLTNATFLTGVIGAIDFTPVLSGTGCSGLSVTGATGAATPQFSIANVPGRSAANTPGSCTVTFYAMTSTGGAVPSNTIAAGGVCYNGGATCNGGSSNSVSATVATALGASKGYNLSSPQSEGTTVRMTITITNLSANPLTGVNIADTLPTSGSAQMRVANPANAASTCGSPTITAVADSTSVAMNGGTVPARAANGTGAAGSCVLQLDVVGAAGTYTNTATVSGTETFANGTTHSVGPILRSAPAFTFSSSLSATKSFNPASVSSGGKSTVTVHLINAGAVALTGLSVTDPLPSGMVVANPSNAYTTCAGGTSITAPPAATSAILNGADIAGNANCDFVFDVVVTGVASWNNIIPAGGIVANGGISNQSAVNKVLTFASPNNPTVSKQTNPSTLTFPGQISQLSINLGSGTQALTNLRLTDFFTITGTAGGTANGMAIAPSPGASSDCPGAIVNAVPGGTSISVSGVSMAASATCTVTVNVTSTAVGGITNLIPAFSIVTDQGLTNQGIANTSLSTQSNLGITKQFIPNVIKPGVRSRLRITFYNATAQPASAISVLDTLPAGVTVPGGPGPTTNCVGANVTSPASDKVQVTGASLPAASGGVAAQCFAEIDVTALAEGDYVNVIPVGALTAMTGGIAATNSQPATDTLRAKLPLEIQKAIVGKTLDAVIQSGAVFTTGSAAATPGAARTLTIRLRNPNSTALTGAAFTDALPGGLVVATPPNASTTCVGGSVFAAAAALSIRLSGATVPASGACTVTVDVLSNISATYTNTIAAGAVHTNIGVSNEDPTSAQLIVSTPPTVSKQFSPAVIPPGGISTLTIVLGNSNASIVTLASIFTDTLPTAPGNIVVAATPNIATTCPTGVGAVTAAAGTGTVRYASGAAVSIGGCTISVDVTGSAAGVHTNSIPAAALQTDFGNNQQPANATLTVSTQGYITGRVFKDNNVVPNGSFDSGTDTPLSGIGIELRSGASCAGALVVVPGLTNPVTTDVLGNYAFAGLPAGTYSVCEPLQPAATTNGKTTAGAITGINGSTGTAGAASNPSASTSQIVGIVLNNNGLGGETSGSNGNNFAEIAPSRISGTVFLDQNNDGIQQGADNGIGGVAINLTGYSYGPDGVDNGGAGDDMAVSQTTATDAGGNYNFANLLPGKYSVTEPTQPAATSNGKTIAGAVANGGTAGTATAVAITPSRISNIVLPPNTVASANNFAEIDNSRRISGTVFLDYDNSGAINGPDHGISGQVINLSGTDINGHAVSATTTTAADGSYSFTGLPEGTYTVTQPAQPAGTTNGITSVGSTGGAATAPATAPSVISAISLIGINLVSGNNNFAEQVSAPDLALAKSHSPAQFSAGNANFYTLAVSNVGNLPTSGAVTVLDTLPAGMTLQSGSGGGWSCSGSTTVTCTSNAVIAAGASAPPITLRVNLVSGLSGQLLTNNAVVSGGGEPPGFAGNNTAVDIVSVADAASIAGTVWTDLNHDRVRNPGEPLMPGWTVELLLNGTVLNITTTNASGAYSFPGLAPNSGYQVRFRNPATSQIFGNAVPNESATPSTSGVVSVSNPGGAITTDGTLKNLTLIGGQNLIQQSLPLDPTGVVYDAVTRQPVSGAVITITGPPGFNPVTQTVGGSATSTTGIDGIYQFVLLPGAPNGTYTLTVSTYPAGYLPSVSSLVPPCPGAPAIGAVPAPAMVQDSITPPASGEAASCPGIVGGGAANSTQYFFSFNLTIGVSADVVNNHIPLDPILGGAIVMTKISPLLNVSRGDLVPYTITATNTLAATLSNININDQIPPGFRYRSGTSTQGSSTSPVSIHAEPTVNGRNLVWTSQTFVAGEKKTWKMMLVVGAGVAEGEYTNQVWALNSVVNSRVSNVASATVRVVPDPNFDCSDIIGKVFDDKNANGYQDQDEPGIANVRIATPRGLLVTTDADGRFHVTCADVPNSDHGSNFVMKLDERTLPSGYRVTTENPRDVRMTRGKMVKLNFGATVHRVVRLELNGAAFVADGVELQTAWINQLAALPTQLKGRPSVLRIAYALGKDSPDLARKRLDAVAARVHELWRQQEGKENAGKDEDKRNPLVIETELEGAQ